MIVAVGGGGGGGGGGVGRGSSLDQRCVGVITASWPKLNALVGDAPSGGVACASRCGHRAGGGVWLRFLCFGARRGGVLRRGGEGVFSRCRRLVTVYCGSSRRARWRLRRRSSCDTVRLTMSGETRSAVRGGEAGLTTTLLTAGRAGDWLSSGV